MPTTQPKYPPSYKKGHPDVLYHSRTMFFHLVSALNHNLQIFTRFFGRYIQVFDVSALLVLMGCLVLTCFAYFISNLLPLLIITYFSGGANPFYNLEKSSVLQEARTFNETPINTRKCCHILTKILYLINQVRPSSFGLDIFGSIFNFF